MVARLFLLLSVLAISFLEASSQVTSSSNDSIDAATMDELAGILSLYQYMLNTVGSSRTPMSAKETIIKDSYQKIFLDSAVQIEDDLVTDRMVVMNKSVQGYFRDVDFFFREAKFDFSQISYHKRSSEVGDEYFEVKYVNTLSLTDFSDSTVTRSQDRFLEIN
ncbi:MAG: stalled ribosome rescue protein Dom34, partial [Paraglaciecola sp.]